MGSGRRGGGEYEDGGVLGGGITVVGRSRGLAAGEEVVLTSGMELGGGNGMVAVVGEGIGEPDDMVPMRPALARRLPIPGRAGLGLGLLLLTICGLLLPIPTPVPNERRLVPVEVGDTIGARTEMSCVPTSERTETASASTDGTLCSSASVARERGVRCGLGEWTGCVVVDGKGSISRSKMADDAERL